MSDENKGVRGPASLRLMGMKVSELPFAAQHQAAELMPAFIAEQRQLAVNGLLARYPKASKAFCEGAIREAESNMVKFKAERQKTLDEMDRYQRLMSVNEGREWDEVESEVTQLVIDAGKPQPGSDEFAQLMVDIEALNATRKPYDSQGLWTQIKLHQGSRDRFDEALESEREVIHNMKDIISLVAERDRLIAHEMNKPIAIE